MERKGKVAGGWAAVAHLGVVCEIDTLKMCLPAQMLLLYVDLYLL